MSRSPLWVILGLVGLLSVAPLVALFVRGLPEGLDGYRRMAHLPDIMSTLSNTLLLGVGSVVVSIALGVPLAWCAARSGGRLRRVIRFIPILPLVFPTVASIIGWVFLFSPQVGYINQLLRQVPPFNDDASGPVDVYSLYFIILITGFNLTSFVYILMLPAIEQISGDYEEAASACGAGRLRTFRSIVLPLLRPGLVYASATVMMIGIGQFTAPLLLGTRSDIDVLTTEIYRLTENPPVDFSLGSALATPFLAFGLLILLAQRYALRNSFRFETQGQGSRARKPARFASLAIVIYGIVAVGLPLVALVHVALSPYWSGEFSLSGLTLSHVNKVLFDSPIIQSAIWTTVIVSLAATAALVPIGLATSATIHGLLARWRPGRRALDYVTSLPLVIPASLYGFAILFVFAGPPFRLYGTYTVLVIAYVVLMLPHAVRAQSAALLSLRPDWWHAARSSGAKPARALSAVILPLSRRGVAAGVALIFVLCSHEFAASVLLRSVNTQVLAAVLYEAFSAATYPAVAVVALLMVAITFLGVAAVLLLGGESMYSREER